MQQCLASLIKADPAAKALGPLIKAMRQESQKPSIASSSAFVLVEWCSVFMQHAPLRLWQAIASEILLTDADALEKCMQASTKHGVAQSAIVVTRRGFRRLFSSAQFREKIVVDAITTLATKTTQPSAKNSILLGVIAGVCVRQPPLKVILETQKAKYFEFYARELVGSKTSIPNHVAEGLTDFFESFVSIEDLEANLLPPIEKGLLRAPEVVLGGVLKPLVSSLPETLDLSKLLDTKLLKPLLSNIKSSNAAIRSGAIAAFRAIVLKCSDTQTMDRVVDEIANPLSAGKVPAAEHKILYSEMLDAVPLSHVGATKIITSLSTAASKEGNESALAAETSALARAAVFALKQGSEIPKPAIDIIVKGLCEKKPASRRLWLLQTGRIIHTLLDSQVTAELSGLVDAVIPKLITNFQEVTANATSAAQSGLVVGAYILTALYPGLAARFPESQSVASLEKAAILPQALSIASKSSFLLNGRVYGKITAEDDLQWFCRALAAAAQNLADDSEEDVTMAWADAEIYLIAAGTTTPKVQQEAISTLSKLYTGRAQIISQIIYDGLWNHITNSDGNDKDVRVDKAKLIYVLRSICLEPREREAFGTDIPRDTLETQACLMLVLARPELIPRSSWINICLRMGLDPGTLAKSRLDDLLSEIGSRTSLDQDVSTGILWAEAASSCALPLT